MKKNRKKNIFILAPWQNFVCSILFVVLFPILPLIIEFYSSTPHNISPQSITIVGILFVVGIGFTSIWFFQFFVCLMLSFAYCVSLALLTSAGINLKEIIIVSSVIMALWHIIERIYRHLIQERPFFEFFGG